VYKYGRYFVCKKKKNIYTRNSQPVISTRIFFTRWALFPTMKQEDRGRSLLNYKPFRGFFFEEKAISCLMSHSSPSATTDHWHRRPLWPAPWLAYRKYVRGFRKRTVSAFEYIRRDRIGTDEKTQSPTADGTNGFRSVRTCCRALTGVYRCRWRNEAVGPS